MKSCQVFLFQKNRTKFLKFKCFINIYINYNIFLDTIFILIKIQFLIFSVLICNIHIKSRYIFNLKYHHTFFFHLKYIQRNKIHILYNIVTNHRLYIIIVTLITLTLQQFPPTIISLHLTKTIRRSTLHSCHFFVFILKILFSLILQHFLNYKILFSIISTQPIPPFTHILHLSIIFSLLFISWYLCTIQHKKSFFPLFHLTSQFQ